MSQNLLITPTLFYNTQYRRVQFPPQQRAEMDISPYFLFDI